MRPSPTVTLNDLLLRDGSLPSGPSEADSPGSDREPWSQRPGLLRHSIKLWTCRASSEPVIKYFYSGAMRSSRAALHHRCPHAPVGHRRSYGSASSTGLGFSVRRLLNGAFRPATLRPDSQALLLLRRSE